MATKIPYVHETWNVSVGCTHSQMRGCDHCFAEDLHTKRHKAFVAGKKLPKQYAKPFSEVLFRPNRLEQPYHWTKPRRIFVCSMSDLFHEAISDEDICRVFQIVQKASQHTYYFFTKRLDRALGFASFQLLPNVYLMASCSMQAEVEKAVSAAVSVPVLHFGLSLEPLLEPIDFYGKDGSGIHDYWQGLLMDTNNGVASYLHWVIVGCESSPNRRPCKVEWVRSIVQQCKVANVPVFVKQVPIEGKCSKNPEEWPEDLRIQEYPCAT
jgi:protein gp37